MKSIQAKRRPPQSNDVILSDVLIGCGQILLGTNTKAFKCLSEDQPHEGLQVCQALEDFKSVGYLENLNAPNDMIEIIDTKHCKQDRIMYFMGRDPYCEGCEFIGKETDIKKEDYTKAETNALMSLMNSDKLIIIPPPHGDVKENCEKVYRSWEAFIKDEDIRQRIFNMVQYESDGNEQLETLAEIFLKYQQLFLRVSPVDMEIVPEKDLFMRVIQSQYRPIKNFRLFSEAATRREAILYPTLSEFGAIKQQDAVLGALLAETNPLTCNIVKDLTQFSDKLRGHRISNKIEECINMEFLNEYEKPEVLLDSYGELFNALWTRMGLQTAQCQLPLIRVLYMGLQMVDKVRQGLLQKGIQMCKKHKNIENIHFPSIEKRQGSSIKSLLERLATIFAKGVNQYNQCQHWDYPEKKLFNLYESGVKALMVNKECSECDLENLEQVSRLSAEAVLHQPRKETALHLVIDASYQNLLKRLSKKGFDVAVFLKKCKDLLGPCVHESSERTTEGKYLADEEVFEIQEKMFSFDVNLDHQIYDLCCYIGLPKMKEFEGTVRNSPRLLINGLTFYETLAFLVQDCNSLGDSGIELGLRLEYARSTLDHLEAMSRWHRTDPLQSLGVRIELMQPLLELYKQDDRLQRHIRVIAARLRGMTFDPSDEEHKDLVSVLEKIACGPSFTNEDVISAFVATKILQNPQHRVTSS